MTLHTAISPDAGARLRERAAQAGEAVAALAARLLQEAIDAPSIDQLLAPFRKQVQESGLRDEELDAFYDRLRERIARN